MRLEDLIENLIKALFVGLFTVLGASLYVPYRGSWVSLFVGVACISLLVSLVLLIVGQIIKEVIE